MVRPATTRLRFLSMGSALIMNVFKAFVPLGVVCATMDTVEIAAMNSCSPL